MKVKMIFSLSIEFKPSEHHFTFNLDDFSKRTSLRKIESKFLVIGDELVICAKIRNKK